MHWRQSGPPGADASEAKFSQPTNSVRSILGVSKRADEGAGEVWGWGGVISFPDTGSNKGGLTRARNCLPGQNFRTTDGDVFTGENRENGGEV